VRKLRHNSKVATDNTGNRYGGGGTMKKWGCPTCGHDTVKSTLIVKFLSFRTDDQNWYVQRCPKVESELKKDGCFDSHFTCLNCGEKFEEPEEIT
jgi:transcription elongation factor Elf1